MSVLHSLYIEQLCERPRPEGRSGQSWSRILNTYQVSFETHLASLTTIEQVWKFGKRCLRREHLKEVFRRFGFEDIFESCISQSVQQESLHQSEERPLFEKDLLAGSADLSELLACESGCSDSVQPSSAKRFKSSLKPSSKPIDLE